MKLEKTPSAVPPPSGLMAWLLDRDERVRRVLWVLYPACAVAVVALLMLGTSTVVLPAAAAVCHVLIARLARGRGYTLPSGQQPVPSDVPPDDAEAVGVGEESCECADT